MGEVEDSTDDDTTEVPPKPPLHERVWGVALKAGRGLFVHHAFDHAATMAFYFFLGTIPLLLFASLVIGNVLHRNGAEDLAAPLYGAMPRVASELLHRELEKIAAADAQSIAPLSLAGFLWLTTNGIHNLMDVFELLIGARPRSWIRQRFIALLWVLGGLATLTAMTWLLLRINGLASAQGAKQLPFVLRQISDFLAKGWQRFGVLVVVVGMLSVGLAIFYRTSVAHPPGVRRKVWTGTFVALILWGLISWAFGAYVSTIADYAVFYGGLATVAVTLLWLYLTSLALLVGAEVNAVLEGMREDEAKRSLPPKP